METQPVSRSSVLRAPPAFFTPGFDPRAAVFAAVRFFGRDRAGGGTVRRFGVGGVGGGAGELPTMGPSPNASHATRTSSTAAAAESVCDAGSRRPLSQ